LENTNGVVDSAPVTASQAVVTFPEPVGKGSLDGVSGGLGGTLADLRITRLIRALEDFVRAERSWKSKAVATRSSCLIPSRSM
jgi:hypothetical protein